MQLRRAPSTLCLKWEKIGYPDDNYPGVRPTNATIVHAQEIPPDFYSFPGNDSEMIVRSPTTSAIQNVANSVTWERVGNH